MSKLGELVQTESKVYPGSPPDEGKGQCAKQHLTRKIRVVGWDGSGVSFGAGVGLIVGVVMQDELTNFSGVIGAASRWWLA
jgi:hypothetical protein